MKIRNTLLRLLIYPDICCISFGAQDMLAIPELKLNNTSTTSASQRKNTSNCSARFHFYKTNLIYECDGECDYDDQRSAERAIFGRGTRRWFLGSKSSDPPLWRWVGFSGVEWGCLLGSLDRSTVALWGRVRSIFKNVKVAPNVIVGFTCFKSREHIYTYIYL